MGGHSLVVREDEHNIWLVPERRVRRWRRRERWQHGWGGRAGGTIGLNSRAAGVVALVVVLRVENAVATEVAA
jgi:hypothetical protein